MNELIYGVANWVWLLFIFVGITLIVAAIYFRQQSKRFRKVIAELYSLNDACNQDALEFFDKAWSSLERVGCLGMQASVEWFGELSVVNKGQFDLKTPYKRNCSVELDDMRFSVVIFMSREASQKESVASLVLTTFTHILEQDLFLKQAEILTSQKRLERYQLFVQHEIKNIAQFIQLLSEQVNAVEDDESKVKLIDRVKSTLPVMSQRARKTVEQMQQPLAELFEFQKIEIECLLQEVVDMYGLDATIHGSAMTTLPRQVLLESLKNILGNYRDHNIANSGINIEINENENNQIKLIIQNSNGQSLDIQTERMFEPFWSSSESGMGLGLFLARELLKQVEGEVEFYKTGKLSGFKITLPVELERS